MDVIMFVAVDMRVSVVMVGLVGVGGFMLAAVAEKYFPKILSLQFCPPLALPVVVGVFVLMFLFMGMIMSLFARVATELSDPARGEKRSDLIVR